MVRKILHIRIDGFPVAVERLRDRSLEGKPVVVCARHSPRSLVFSASREARGEGVHEGLPLTRALQRCRRLVVVPPDEKWYSRMAGEIIRLLEHYSPLVEPDLQGRFYLDMTGTGRLFGKEQDSSFRILRNVRETMGLTGTAGIGSNKLVSGIAARVVESHGDLYAVPSGSESSFLAPFRAHVLPALRSAGDRMRLREFNIRRIEQLAQLSPVQLNVVFQKRGSLVRSQALGIDDRPVRPPAHKPFVFEEITLDEDTNDDKILLGVLYRMTERACGRMRGRKTTARTLWLHIRYTDGLNVFRRTSLPCGAALDRFLFQQLERLYWKACLRRQRVRYLSLTFTDLVLQTGQTDLFERSPQVRREEAILSALDEIRVRYGEESIRVGRTLDVSWTGP